MAKLGEVKDAIGEWHDWEQLIGIATPLLDHGASCKVMKHLSSTSKSKYEHAISLVNQLQSNYLRARATRRGSRRDKKTTLSADVLKATSAIAEPDGVIASSYGPGSLMVLLTSIQRNRSRKCSESAAPNIKQRCTTSQAPYDAGRAIFPGLTRVPGWNKRMVTPSILFTRGRPECLQGDSSGNNRSLSLPMTRRHRTQYVYPSKYSREPNDVWRTIALHTHRVNDSKIH